MKLYMHNGTECSMNPWRVCASCMCIQLHQLHYDLPVKKEALNPFPFLLFVELICSNTHREDPLTGAPYKRLVLPISPICVGKRHHQLRL